MCPTPMGTQCPGCHPVPRWAALALLGLGTHNKGSCPRGHPTLYLRRQVLALGGGGAGVQHCRSGFKFRLSVTSRVLWGHRGL